MAETLKIALTDGERQVVDALGVSPAVNFLIGLYEEMQQRGARSVTLLDEQNEPHETFVPFLVRRSGLEGDRAFVDVPRDDAVSRLLELAPCREGAPESERLRRALALFMRICRWVKESGILGKVGLPDMRGRIQHQLDLSWMRPLLSISV
ncbi:MAG: hypothetical protein H6760_00035 [Candidatus Nomurabacteria bacterium]|nr:MAG: hypothetical protein H6760_00035 [Candidatus Nomurabacteria bacterium]